VASLIVAGAAEFAQFRRFLGRHSTLPGGMAARRWGKVCTRVGYLQCSSQSSRFIPVPGSRPRPLKAWRSFGLQR
jgi:hypothetical protein